MSKKSIVIISVVAVIAVVLLSVIGTYNSMVSSRENVETASATISTQLQRRADLIPNFVATVKGYSDYEQETYTAVTEARAAVSAASGTAEQSEAADQLNRAISIWVNAVTEAYPDLKASEQYQQLTYELSGTENRIATARKDYNDAVKKYNASIKKFPKNLFAGMFGFEPYEYFDSGEGTETVPEVSFE